MKKKRLLQLIALLGLCVGLTGCYDKLGAVDLSGKVELTLSNDGWAYRTISNKSVDKSDLSRDTDLDDYRHLLELSKEIRIGKNDYHITSRFGPEYNFFNYHIDPKNKLFQKFHSLVYSYTTHQVIDTFVTRSHDSGDSWYSEIGDFSPKSKTNELERDGLFELIFHEPSIGRDCIIYSYYSISGYAKRNVDQEGNLIAADDPDAFKNISIKGSSKLKIGLRQCLTGSITVAGKKIWLYVIDWNLDGKFTAADYVWNDYTEQTLPFETEIRLTNSLEKSKDNTYILRLENPVEDKYVLDIQLLSRAKV